uniref:ST8 alpha-N-acetyl-neuraminide alpha-2,8-sialyltransferase 7.1 n=1 Tax=Sinocyclocheilus grahami TaxID=75366 RepID=A0A672Q316_SINGR
MNRTPDHLFKQTRVRFAGAHPSSEDSVHHPNEPNSDINRTRVSTKSASVKAPLMLFDITQFQFNFPNKNSVQLLIFCINILPFKLSLPHKNPNLTHLCLFCCCFFAFLFAQIAKENCHNLVFSRLIKKMRETERQPEERTMSNLPGRRLGRCAVVGSGGILKNSSCGREIDSADFVIRFNLATINDSDVGLKTDLITINPSQIRSVYKNMVQDPDPLVERVSVYGNASLAMAAFAYTFCTGKSMTTLKALHPVRPQQPVVFFSPLYLRTLDRFWKGRGLKSIRLSSGFMLINTALELCEHVHVYGFWPFGTDLKDNPVPYHYYDALSPHRYMHKMPEEFVRLLQLHSQGALTLHLRPCVDL